MARRRSWAPWLCTAVAALALGGVSEVPGQEGPLRVDAERPTRALSLQPPQADLELLYRYRQNNIDSGAAASSTSTESRFEERLDLKTTGFVYHPNFLELRLDGSLGLTQTSYDEDGEATDENSTFNEWDVSGTFLRKEPLSLTLYSRRQTETSDRQFGASVDTTLTTTGADLELRSGPLPTRVGVFHDTQQQTGLDDAESFDITRDVLTWHTDYRPSDSQSMALDLAFESVSESTGGSASTGSNESQSFDTTDLTLSHGLLFGSRDQYSLESSLGYHDQTGEHGREQTRWDERLRLRHTDHFETHYRLAYDEQSYVFPAQTQEELTGEAGFRHQLYQSLTTYGTIGVRDLQRSDDGSSLAEYAELGADYHKKVPLGTLTVGLSGGLEQEEFDQRTEVTLVRDVRLVLTDDAPATIMGSGIVSASVVITDTTGLIVYTLDRDYRVTAFPEYIEIRRVIAGRIAAGQTVLVDYELEPASAHSSTTENLSASVRYSFERGVLKGLGLYARLTNQDQTIDAPAGSTFTPNSLVETTFGADYRFWHMTVGAERRNHDSTISPYETDRLFARYGERLGARTTLSLSAVYTSSNYTTTGDQVDTLLVSGAVYQQLSARLRGSLTVLWLDRQDTLAGASQGFEQDLELRWTFRQTSAYLQLRNAMNDDFGTSRTYQYIHVGVKRQF